MARRSSWTRSASTKTSGWIAGRCRTRPGCDTVERFTRTAFDTLRYEVTIDDPGAYTAPFSGRMELKWEDGTELFEYVCQEENYAPTLMVGQGTTVDRSSRIVP
jgi:hypothetical protein